MQNRSTGIIIQARLSSERLPGKVLLPLAGKPMLSWLVQRLQSATDLPPWLIATSDHPSDDPLAEFCRAQAYPCFRGPLDQVATRLLAAADSQGWQRWVRISGDSPLLDPDLIRQALRLADQPTQPEQSELPELVTNVQPRSFPVGQSVELLTSDLLRRRLSGFSPVEQEHVTLGLYQRLQGLRLVNFKAPADYSQIRLVIDTAEDFSKIESLIHKLGPEAQRAYYLRLVQLAV